MLRHFGQGLMSHIAVTSVNRYYETVRGKASAIVNQGFTLAEATLPITISAVILAVGWRWSWYALGAVAAGVVLPLLLVLIADHRRRMDATSTA
jgi:MFS family permease